MKNPCRLINRFFNRYALIFLAALPVQLSANSINTKTLASLPPPIYDAYLSGSLLAVLASSGDGASNVLLTGSAPQPAVYLVNPKDGAARQQFMIPEPDFPTQFDMLKSGEVVLNNLNGACRFLSLKNNSPRYHAGETQTSVNTDYVAVSPDKSAIIACDEKGNLSLLNPGTADRTGIREMISVSLGHAPVDSLIWLDSSRFAATSGSSLFVYRASMTSVSLTKKIEVKVVPTKSGFRAPLKLIGLSGG